MPESVFGAVRPTLFIGLGGTGKEVLLRLRRRFYERWRIKGLPITEFLWVDTDPTDTAVTGETLDEIDAELKFDERETLALLGGKVGDSLGLIFSEREHYRHIHKWLPEEVETYGSQIADGAGGVRSVGRLTFFDRYQKHIEPRVREKLNELRQNDRHNATTDKYLPGATIGTPQVYLVFSVAGGTGSGSFLDMAFLLKDIGIQDITGVIVLPNVYYDNAHRDERALRSYGSAYSALKELEHYSRRIRKVRARGDEDHVQIDYEVDWTGKNPKLIQGPPFKAIYLCEIANEDGINAGHRTDLFRGISETLFLDFMPGRFSTQKRSRQSDMFTSMASVDDDEVGQEGAASGQSFSRRYGAFGLSKIEIPVESIREACGCRLCVDILNYIDRPRQNPDLMGVVKQQVRGKFDMAGLHALYGTEWKQTLDAGLNEVCPEQWPRVDGSKESLDNFVNTLPQVLDQWEEAFLSSAGYEARQWGRVTAAIRNLTPQALRALREALRSWTAESLDRPGLGLNALRGDTGLLALLLDHFRKMYNAPAPTESANQLKALDAEAKEYKRRRDMALGQMREALSSYGIRALGVRGWTLETLYKRARENAFQIGRARATALLVEEAAKLAKDADTHLQDLKNQVDRRGERLDPIRTHFDSLQKSFLQFGPTYSSVRLYEKSDFENFYLLEFDTHSQKHQPISVTKEYERFLGTVLGARKGTWDLFESWQRDGDTFLKSSLRLYTTDRFKQDFDQCRQDREHHRDCGRFTSVFDHPVLKENASAKYEQFVKGALPMLRRGVRFTGAHGEIKAVYLATPTRTGDNYRRFFNAISQQLSTKGYFLREDSNVLESEDPTCVYLYTEVHAFSLPTVDLVVRDCHEAYYDFYRGHGADRKTFSTNIPLHLSKLWEGEFEDLKPVTERDDVRRFEALEILSVGPTIGVVGIQEGNGGRGFIYKEQKGLYADDVSLGRNKREAIETLSRDESLRRDLLRHLGQREARIIAAAPANGESTETSPTPSETRLAYLWALTFLNLKCFPESTRENYIVQQRIKAMRFAPAGSDMTDLTTAQRIKRCEEELSDKVKWSGAFPVLNGLKPVAIGKEEL